MKLTSIIVFVLISLFISNTSKAVPIIIGGPTISNVDLTFNFEENFDKGIELSNQYASSGLGFQTLQGAGFRYWTANFCNNTANGISGGYVYLGVIGSNGVNTGCIRDNSSTSIADLVFDRPLEALSFEGFSSPNGSSIVISRLLRGQVVASDQLAPNSILNTSFSFTDVEFDTLRFAASVNGGILAIDNLSLRYATHVPTPQTLSLFVIVLTILFARTTHGLTLENFLYS